MITGKTTSLIAVFMSSSAGGLIFLILPLVVGLIAEHLHLDEQQVGVIISIYFTGFLVTSVLAFFFFGRFKHKSLVSTGYFLLVPGLLGCGFSSSTGLLLASLAVSGLGSGLLYGTSVSIISSSTESERNFGIMIAVQQATALLLFYSLPTWVFSTFGYLGCWITLASLIIAMSISSRWLNSVVVEKANSNSTQPTHAIVLSMASLLLHFCLMSAIWAFVERLGVSRGYSYEDIAVTLAVSTLGGFAGAVIAAAIGNRLGHSFPHVFSSILLLIIFYVLSATDSWMIFLMSVTLFSAAWSYCLAYQMASVGNLSDRYAVLIPGVQGIAAVAGPILGGVIIATGGYSGLLLATAVAVIMASLGFLYQRVESRLISN